MYEIAIITVNYNLSGEIRHLLASIKKYVLDLKYKVIVVDNNSPDRSIEELQYEFPDVDFIFLNSNYGFGHGNNVGANNIECMYYLFMNPDAYFTENSPKIMMKYLEQNKSVGVIGPVLKYEDGKSYESAMKVPNIKQEFMDIFGVLSKGINLNKKIRNKLFKEKRVRNRFCIWLSYDD